MTGLLPADIDRLKASISIAAVIGETLQLGRDGRHHVALCPFHEEKTPSFYVYDDGYHCFGCGAHGDVLDWLMKAHRITFPAAVGRLGRAVGVDRTSQPVQAPKLGHPRRSATADTFMRCWDQGVDPIGTIIELYLRDRGGLAVPTGAPIRFHPRCQRGANDVPGGPEFWPAMLALMTDPVSGRPVGLHRTYLLPDGSGKAPATTRGRKSLRAKMILGTWGVVRLAPDEEVGRALCVAEGIENALTAMQVIGWGPTWAVGPQDCIKNLPVLPWIEACLMTFPAFRGQWFTIDGLQPADGERGRIGIVPVG